MPFKDRLTRPRWKELGGIVVEFGVGEVGVALSVSRDALSGTRAAATQTHLPSHRPQQKYRGFCI